MERGERENYDFTDFTVEKGVEEVINESILQWFDRVERMKNDKMPK